MNHSKNEWIIPALILILLVGFLGYLSQSKTTVPIIAKNDSTKLVTIEPPYTFEAIFYEIRRIDVKFHTDFRNESLRGPLLRTNAAQEYLAYLNQLRATIANKTEPAEDEPIQHLLNAREEMLTSQIYFQKALSYGKAGVFQAAFQCDNAREIREATQLYNLTLYHGTRALAQFDDTLSYPPARPLIGINTQKPKFYSEVLSEIAKVASNNYAALDKYCNETLKSTANSTTA
jgi:hypothetical protein